ncbi:MAG TPA: holo-ACP synthase [Gaiellaceae bacterium]|nr:holo-ACP synthase [Gaiellaceae bacterium]
MVQTVISRLRRSCAVGVGIDVVEVADVSAALASPRADRYLEMVYSEAERRDCATQDGGVDAGRLAARFAAKEAAWKALGDAAMQLDWRSVEVVRGRHGQPSLRLNAPAARIAQSLGVRRLAVSLTHEPTYAAAVVVATR